MLFQILAKHWFLFTLIFGGNIAFAALMPYTKGFSNIPATLACLFVSFTVIYAFSTAVHKGVDMSLLGPIIGIIVPVCGIIAGLTLNGESVSINKLAWLAGAVVCIYFSAA